MNPWRSAHPKRGTRAVDAILTGHRSIVKRQTNHAFIRGRASALVSHSSEAVRGREGKEAAA